MIEIKEKELCSGCKACSNICPIDAITYEYDSDGFFYPIVNKEKCIRCGKCEKACPYQTEGHGVPLENKSGETSFYAIQLKDKNELLEVSSGGAFQAFAHVIIREGGIVYGATQENVDNIYHVRITDDIGLKKIRKSKYFQSDIGKSYISVKRDLMSGKTVLFSGTGCQIAGLLCYLGKKYETLYTCEVVCHGVPSKRVWECYRREKEALTGKKIVDLVFRDKSSGWSNNNYRITYDDGSVEYERSSTQLFHFGYLLGLFYRPSCGECPFASMPRVADITLADFWKYKGPFEASNMGVSLVGINNMKGRMLLDSCRDLIEIEQSNYKDALDSCRHMDEHPKENKDRRDFLNLTFTKGYFAAADKYIVKRNKIMNRLKRKLCFWVRR